MSLNCNITDAGTGFVGALRPTSVPGSMVLGGAITAESFLTCIEQALVPTLRFGDVVTLDNLPAHKGTAVQAAVEAAGATHLFLPPYSYDFNPVENAFAKAPPSWPKGSRRYYARRLPVPSISSGASMGNASTSSRRTNTPTTSLPQSMTHSDRKNSQGPLRLPRAGFGTESDRSRITSHGVAAGSQHANSVGHEQLVRGPLQP